MTSITRFVTDTDLSGVYITYYPDNSIGHALPPTRGYFKDKFQINGQTYFTFEHPLYGTIFKLNQHSFMNDTFRITFTKDGSLIKSFP